MPVKDDAKWELNDTDLTTFNTRAGVLRLAEEPDCPYTPDPSKLFCMDYPDGCEKCIERASEKNKKQILEALKIRARRAHLNTAKNL